MAESSLRFEHKFLIRMQTAMELQSRFRSVMMPDAHAKNGCYHIRSLYFDDLDNRAFYEKINGEDPRSKFRIRFYDDDLSFIQLEKKEKLGNLTRKTAVRITLQDAEKLISGDLSFCRNNDFPLCKEFLALSLATHFQPAVLVDYDRFPFVYPESRVRITIDTNVSSRLADRNALHYRGSMFPVLPDDMAILEVKFDGTLPQHIIWILEDVQKQVQAISKYCLCRELYQ